MIKLLSNLNLPTIIKISVGIIFFALITTIFILTTSNKSLKVELKDMSTVNANLKAEVKTKDSNVSALKKLIANNEESYLLQIQARDQADKLFCINKTPPNKDVRSSVAVTTNMLQSEASLTRKAGRNVTDNESYIVINFINSYWSSLLF